MTTATRTVRRQAAADAFNLHESRQDGEAIVAQLDDALILLSDLVFLRIHGEVEQHLGVDSLYNPVSEVKSEAKAKAETKLFLACEAGIFAEEREYVKWRNNWCETWLAAMLFDERDLGMPAAERLAAYRDKSSDDRRRGFSLVLERTFPEAIRAPLVIYRLLQPAARLATALAFGRPDQAQAQRDRQLVVLPSILDCSTCHGEVLPSGQACVSCGNPFWKYDLLTAEW
jgi:hypothetical protein